MVPKLTNRFAVFNPEERVILQTLLEEHANTVSQIAGPLGIGVAKYLLAIEALEAEAKDGG